MQPVEPAPDKSPLPSLGFRRMTAALVVAILVVVAAATLAISHLRQVATDRAVLDSERLALAVDLNLEALIGKLDLVLNVSSDAISAQLAAGEVDTLAITAFLERQRGRVPLLTSLRAANVRGEVIWGDGVLSPPVDYADHPLFQRLRDHPELGFVLGEPTVSRTHGGAVIPVARRLVGPDGEFAGAAYGAVRLDDLRVLLKQLGPEHTVTLRDSELRTIAHHPLAPDAADTANKAPPPALLQALQAGLTQGRFVTEAAVGDPDVPARLHAYRQHPVHGYVVEASLDLPQVQSTVASAQWTILVLAATLILAALAFGASDHRSRQRLHQAMVAERQIAEQLRLSERRHRLLADHARDVVWTMDADGRITYVSPAVQALRGFTPEEAMQQPLHATHPPASAAQTQAYVEALSAALLAGRPPPDFHGELEYICQDGSTMWAEVWAFPLLDAAGRLVEVLGVSRDISARRQHELEMQRARLATEQANEALQAANAKLERISATDPLTGAWNRRHFEREIAAAVARAQRQDCPLSVVMLDVDRFKQVNDRYGHPAGDRVLVAITKALQDGVREGDVVSRWGGEEFAVLLPQTDAAAALDTAQRLRLAVATLDVSGVGPVTASFGVAEWRPSETTQACIHRADLALYAAKNAGRNRVEQAV
jgi:diguanylate cyclase (GGDEF)-like protein/PAS domain S-box-containing protein